MGKLWFVFLLLLLAAVSTVSCSQSPVSPQNSYVDVTPAEARVLIEENPDLIIIDLSPNYLQGHLPGAINYYISDGSLTEAIPSLDKSRPYLVYCTIQAGSIQGAQEMVDAGFQRVFRLEGNYQAWVDAGYPVEY